MKYIAYLIVTIGVLFFFYGFYELYKMKTNEKERMEEVETLISDKIIEAGEEINFDYSIYNKGETVGSFHIPKLNRELPIVEGTDEEELAEGVGHFSKTAFPGQGKQILLSGHRDTVFRNFGELEIGDELHVKMKSGIFIYVIEGFEIVDAHDTSVINLDSEEEVLTVSTCYPFSFIGSAPDRFIVYAYPK